MMINEEGLKLIKGFEGLRLTAYQDIVGVWTIGYGSTRYENGKSVMRGDKLPDVHKADSLLLSTLKTYVDAVNRSVKVELTTNQFNSLVSITYNVGVGIMRKSTLLTKLNSGDYQGAADQFLLWNKITDPKTGKKVVSNTLVKRREKERALFLKA